MNKEIQSLTVEELKNGFVFEEKRCAYVCLFCGTVFERGVVFKQGGRLVDAQKAACLHIREAHDSVFAALLREGKKNTGLTEVQSDMLLGFFGGVSDGELARGAGISPSTVRFQRFSFREKARQARVILALEGLLEHRLACDEAPEVHPNATMVDERYMTTGTESERIAGNFFVSLDPPVLKTLSSKEKNKLVILKIIAGQFEPGKHYTEKQVNDILRPIYGDYVSIRRYLIEYGFMDRTADGQAYWLK